MLGHFLPDVRREFSACVDLPRSLVFGVEIMLIGRILYFIRYNKCTFYRSISTTKHNIRVRNNTYRGFFLSSSMPNRLTNTPPASRSHATSNKQRNAPPTARQPPLSPGPSPSPLRERLPPSWACPINAGRPSTPCPRCSDASTSQGLQPINEVTRVTAECGSEAEDEEERDEVVVPCAASAAAASSGRSQALPAGVDTLRKVVGSEEGVCSHNYAFYSHRS